MIHLKSKIDMLVKVGMYTNNLNKSKFTSSFFFLFITYQKHIEDFIYRDQGLYHYLLSMFLMVTCHSDLKVHFGSQASFDKRASNY
jgi:hypothetical protein